MSPVRRTSIAWLALAAWVGLEAAAALARPEVAPLIGPLDAALALALASPLALLAGLPRAGLAALAGLLVAVAGPHAARVAGASGLVGPSLVLAAAVLASGLAWPRAGPALLGASLLLAPLPALLAPGWVVGARAPPGPGGPDLLLVTVDTLRADAAPPPPGGGWLRFTRAVSPAPWTLPAIDGLMRGAAVRQHLGGLPSGAGFTRPADALEPLAARLAAKGYRTGAAVSNPHLRPELGHAEGFERFIHSDRWIEPHHALHALQAWRWRLTGRVQRLRARRDPLLVREALAWWEAARGAPRFLWVHLLLPHEYRRDARLPEGEPAPTDGPGLKRAYEANVEVTRALLAELVEGVGPEAWVALTSDHGESFGEGGHHGHGGAFVDEQVLVPLALRGAGEGVVERQVALQDLADALVAADPARLRAGREVVELGGIRRDASAFALRLEGGETRPRPPPAPSARHTFEVDAGLAEALRALGYGD